MNKCLITGCALQLEHSHDYVWGDLHQYGDRFVFNAVVDRDGSTFWRRRAADAAGRLVTVPMSVEYFERRGVFVLPADRLLLNAAAQAHVERWA